MTQATGQIDLSVIADIDDLEQRIGALERRLERQASAIERALDALERAEEELKARIGVLEKELLCHSR